jgi:hypothetical protein
LNSFLFRLPSGLLFRHRTQLFFCRIECVHFLFCNLFCFLPRPGFPRLVPCFAVLLNVERFTAFAPLPLWVVLLGAFGIVPREDGYSRGSRGRSGRHKEIV